MWKALNASHMWTPVLSAFSGLMAGAHSLRYHKAMCKRGEAAPIPSASKRAEGQSCVHSAQQQGPKIFAQSYGLLQTPVGSILVSSKLGMLRRRYERCGPRAGLQSASAGHHERFVKALDFQVETTNRPMFTECSCLLL